jgi:hypothetical protein
MLNGKFMPECHEMVECHDGQVLPVMFFYAIEGADYSEIAKASGYDIRMATVEADDSEDAEAWLSAYEADGAKVLGEWQPVAPEGYSFGGKWHTEDGIAACFLRKLEGM